MSQWSESWLGKNIVAWAALVVSLITLVPLLAGCLEQSNATKSSIAEVQNDEVVTGEHREVSVEYTNRKDETDLWLVLRSGVEDSWYPQARVIPAQCFSARRDPSSCPYMPPPITG